MRNTKAWTVLGQKTVPVCNYPKFDHKQGLSNAGRRRIIVSCLGITMISFFLYLLLQIFYILHTTNIPQPVFVTPPRCVSRLT